MTYKSAGKKRKGEKRKKPAPTLQLLIGQYPQAETGQGRKKRGVSSQDGVIRLFLPSFFSAAY